MRPTLAALLLVASSALPAHAHGGGCFRDPPGPPPPPAATTARPAHAAPGDSAHRCDALRGIAGEVPPETSAAFDPPPPPPPPDPERQDWPLRHRVVDAAGEPLAGALLWSGGVPLAVSDGTGVWKADPGSEPTALVVTAAGHAPATLRWDGEQVASVNALRLARGAELAGRLVHADGSPVTGARVRLVPDLPRVPETFAVVAVHAGWWTRDVDGDLSFAGLVPGRYRLLVAVPGMPERTVLAGIEPGGEPFTAVLPRALSPRTRTLAVRLLGIDGEPVASWMAEARTACGRRERVAAEDGVATVTVTGTGPLRIIASSVAACVGPTPLAACAHDVPSDVTELTLRLAPAPGTRALVFSAPPEGSDGAFVRVVDRFRGTCTETLWLGPSGLTVPVFDDAVLAVIWAPAKGTSRTTVGDTLYGVIPGTTLALPPADPGFATIDGRVVRPDGTWVAGAIVRARSSLDAADTDLVTEVRADARGLFRLPGVRGRVTLAVTSPGLSNAEQPYVVTRRGTYARVVVREERVD